jgi:hypothetical protein
MAKEDKDMPAGTTVAPPAPVWVTDMHQHFQRTGFYRQSDLGRILGDPRQAFEGQASDELLAASRIVCT